MQRLVGQVAVVTGATRGAGLGIARVLGEEGATVYVTGRSVRGAPAVAEYPGSVEDAADNVNARGGHGIPVRCDHTRRRVGAEPLQPGRRGTGAP